MTHLILLLMLQTAQTVPPPKVYDCAKFPAKCGNYEVTVPHPDKSKTLYHYEGGVLKWTQEIAAPKMVVPQMKQSAQPEWVLPNANGSCKPGYALTNGDLTQKCWRVR